MQAFMSNFSLIRGFYFPRMFGEQTNLIVQFD